MHKFLLFGILLTTFVLHGAKRVEYSQGDFRRISAMAAKVFDRNHYSEIRMTPELSAKIFDGFFDSLDPAHMLFTSGDVAKFASSRERIGFDLQRGECDLAFQVYEVYRKRFEEFRAFTAEMLKSKIDFTVDEEYCFKREKAPRPADEAAMHELWRKRIKNDLLLFRLMERAEQEENAKNAKEKQDGKSDKKAGVKAAERKAATPEERILQRQRDLGNDVAKRDKIDILGTLLDAMAQAYGAHSNYQPPKLNEDFEINMSLSLSGIGATLTSENGYIKVVELIPGGPAEQSGKLKVNDRLLSVTQENGETTDLLDMPVSKAVQFIRGPKDSKLTLTVLSGESDHPVQVVLTRDKISLKAGAAKGEVKEIKDAAGKAVKVGLITLPSFYMDFDGVNRGDANARRASSDVRRILEEFKKEKVESVLIDLRRNGGGSFPDAVLLTGLFLPGGPVVQVRGTRRLELESDEDPAVYYSGPLVVLTSKFSASATEIFSAALRDADRAVLVGDSRTFGKGTVLRVESLDDYNGLFGKGNPAGALTFETAMFYRTRGGSVQQLGIAPDIKLPSLSEEMKVGEMYMDNHLPWDSIDPVIRTPWDKGLAAKIAVLKEKSAARIAADPKYRRLLRQIEIYRKYKDRTTVSLNEKRRWEEYRKERQVTEEAERLMEESDAFGKPAKNDIILDEALRVAADLYQLSEVK